MSLLPYHINPNNNHHSHPLLSVPTMPEGGSYHHHHQASGHSSSSNNNLHHYHHQYHGGHPLLSQEGPPTLPRGMDLRLASSYLPALVCAVQSALIAMLARALIPLGGASALALGVALHRSYAGPYFPYHHAFFDVNAIMAYVLAVSVAAYEHQLHGAAWIESKGTGLPSTLVLLIWMLLAMATCARPNGMLAPAWELFVLCGLYGLLCACAPDARPNSEELPWAAIRALALVASVASSIYTAQAPDTPLALLLLRLAPVFLAPLTPALLLGVGFTCVTLLRWNRLRLITSAPDAGPGGGMPSSGGIHSASAASSSSSASTNLLSSASSSSSASMTGALSSHSGPTISVLIGSGGPGGSAPASLASEIMMLENLEEEQTRLREALARHKGGYAEKKN